MFLFKKLKRKNKIQISQTQSLLYVKKKRVSVANCSALLEKKTSNSSYYRDAFRHKLYCTTVVDNIPEGSGIQEDEKKQEKPKEPGEWGLQIQN
jgi:hypothetical protein